MTPQSHGDEAAQFTKDEFLRAFLLITTPEEASLLASELSEPRADDDAGPPWRLAPDVLDLLSLVSEECARRVQHILELSEQDAEVRRAQARARFASNGP
jgi:hypothetical protein